VSHITLNPMTAPKLIAAIPAFIAMHSAAVDAGHFTLRSYDDDVTI
jgi:hypothetical protein